MRLEIGAVLAQEVCEVSILSLATLVPVAASQSYNMFYRKLNAINDQ